MKCGNRCKVSKPVFDDKDIANIAKHEGIKIEEVKEQYLELGEDKDWVINTLLCPFLSLEDNLSVI